MKKIYALYDIDSPAEFGAIGYFSSLEKAKLGAKQYYEHMKENDPDGGLPSYESARECFMRIIEKPLDKHIYTDFNFGMDEKGERLIWPDFTGADE